METTMKKLHHDQLVRGAGFPVHTQKIRVVTLKGYIRESLMRYGIRLTKQLTLEQAVDMEVQESVKRDVACGRTTEWSWTLQSPAVLTDDYTGKEAELQAERAAIKSAPALEHGEIVEIEGDKYRVSVIGPEYSDPIKFFRS